MSTLWRTRWRISRSSAAPNFNIFCFFLGSTMRTIETRKAKKIIRHRNAKELKIFCQSLTVIDLSVLANFKKIWIKVLDYLYLHNYAYQRNDIQSVWKVWYWVFMSLRAPFFRMYFRYRFVLSDERGLVVTTGYYWGLLHRDFFWKGMRLLFSMG